MSSRTPRLGLATLAVVASVLLSPVRAEIVRYTIGIDVNCPTGLGE